MACVVVKNPLAKEIMDTFLLVILAYLWMIITGLYRGSWGGWDNAVNPWPGIIQSSNLEGL